MDQNINQMIGRIDERTEMTLRLMKEFKDEFRNVSDDHEMRLSSLEHDRSHICVKEDNVIIVARSCCIRI